MRYVQGIPEPPASLSEGSRAIHPATNEALYKRHESYWKRLDEIDWETVPAGDQCPNCRKAFERA